MVRRCLCRCVDATNAPVWFGTRTVRGWSTGGRQGVPSVPSAQFCCERKTALKIKIYFLKDFILLDVPYKRIDILQLKKKNEAGGVEWSRKRLNLLQLEKEKCKQKPRCCRACLVTSQNTWQRMRVSVWSRAERERNQQH